MTDAAHLALRKPPCSVQRIDVWALQPVGELHGPVDRKVVPLERLELSCVKIKGRRCR